VLGEACDRAEGLAALAALDLHPAVGVHPLVAAQVGELSVALETHLKRREKCKLLETP
jgi:hypothetical protein